ncbi:MAG TPA: recombinase family protein [Caulobacteraceae bacterium]
MTHVVGYARTSTADQAAGLNAQIRDLEAAGATKVFSEQLSGKDKARPQLEAALDYLRDGDTFLGTKIDRVARSVVDLRKILERAHGKGAAFRIIEPPLNLPPGDQDAIATATLTIFGAIAEMEVSLMKERQREGIREAQAAGKFVGRQPTAQKKAQALLDAVASRVEPTAAAKSIGISRASAFRILKAEKLAQELRAKVEAGEEPREAAAALGVTWAAAKRVLGPLAAPKVGAGQTRTRKETL